MKKQHYVTGRVMSVLAFILAFNSSFTVLAQEPDSTVLLKETVINYEAELLTPVTFQNISSKTIETETVGQEPSFMLANTPSVTNYSDAGSFQGYSYFRMRGIDQTRINITFDGVPLNEPEDQGAYFSNYPDVLNSASRIQIQRGVGTTKNGVACFGGSVQLFSPNLLDSAYSTLGFAYGSFNSLRAYGEYNSGLKGKKAVYARVSEVYSNGYKHHSSNHSQSALVSTGLFLDKTVWKVNALVGHQQNDMAWLGVSDSLIAIDRRSNANSDEQDEFLQSLLQVQNYYQISEQSSLRSSVYQSYLNGNYDFDLNNFIGLPSTDEMYNYAFESNLLGFYNNYTLSTNKLNATIGVHANTYRRSHTGTERTLGLLYTNTGYKNEVSAFTKLDYSLGKWQLFADAQYRSTRFDYEGSVHLTGRTWNFLNPKAGLSLALSSNMNLYYSLGKVGREPTRNDMFRGNDDLAPDSLGQSDIHYWEPEYVVDHELGIRMRQKKTYMNLNFYLMDFDNEIVLEGNFGPNGLALTNNVAQSIRTGVELDCGYNINENWKLRNSSSFNHSEIKDQGTAFAPILTPKLIINQDVVFTKSGLSVLASVRYQSESFIDFANTAFLDDYVLLNGAITYATGKIELGLRVNNITNTKYINHGYIDYDGSAKYFVQAPMSVLASLKYHI